MLVVYDTSDPDWTLVEVNQDFGFAPSNYIEIVDEATPAATSAVPPPPAPEEPPVPSLPSRPTEAPREEEAPSPTSPQEAASNPAAAAIADIIHRQHASPVESEPSRPVRPPAASYEPEDEETPPPVLPQRPPSQQVTSSINEYAPEPSPPPRPQYAEVKDRKREGHVQESPPYPRMGDPAPRSPAGYHMYNVNEMIEVMGKRKKMPTTLGINVATGTIFLSPEDDDNQQEWTADKMTHYSMEGKHVFIDLVRPSKSVDLHAGAKDTAREIVSALSEIFGAYRAEGFREVLAAGSGGGGSKKGHILYDFKAQGEDEVSVEVDDEVIVVDDTKSEEWWMVRRLRNGKEGVVPSSYVEVTGFTSQQSTGLESGMSAVERNRMDESRMAKDASRKSRTDSMDLHGGRHKRESKSASKASAWLPPPNDSLY